MKKNISINISGIIFHIEEDAYEQLKGYLDSISNYFSSFDGSHEIIADIESRIAEIFLGKLDEEKQIITQEDVESLISTMGSIADFQAIEDPEPAFDSSTFDDESSSYSGSESGRKKLYRDYNRKIVGGVCAGIAHYFNIDSIWIRLIFLAILFASWGTILLVYLIMWIVLPKSTELSEDKKLKKMYRDSDSKVIAGVSSGIANYFGVEVTVIRVLFVLITIAFGTGILAYIILWIILPEAKSITDKVRMKGDPVTLSNIETNIKESLNVKDKDEENIFIKILLFPFRLISSIITGIGRALSPLMKFLVDFIRVAVGMFIVFIGFIIVFATVVSFGATLGVLSSGLLHGFGDVSVPLELMADAFPVSAAFSALMVVVIPSLFLILVGSSIVAKRVIFSSSVGWTLFAIFIVSVVILSVYIPGIAFQFNEDGDHRITTTYDLGNKTAVLALNEVDLQGYDVTRLQLRGYDGTEYKLEQIFEARGKSRKDAIENAKMVTYNVVLEDSIFHFDSNMEFKEDASFRAQSLEMTLYIPYNQKFTMDYDLRHILKNTMYRYDYRVSQIEDNTWTFTENGLQCLTCSEASNYSPRSYRGEDYDRSEIMDDFQAVSIEGPFKVDFIRSEDYKVLLKGSVEDLDDMDILQDGDKIKISYRDSKKVFNKKQNRGTVRLMILTPYLDEIEITGACKASIDNYRQQQMSIYISGASTLNADIYIDELQAELTGAAELELKGSGQEMTADLFAASHLHAQNFRVRDADIEAHAASTATVYVTNTLEIEEKLASRVVNKGRATEINNRRSSDEE